MRCLWPCLLLLLVGSVSGAQVYRSIDADGNVTYGDRPASDADVTVFIDTATATPITAEAASGENESTAEDEVDEVVTVGPSAEEMAAERMENCGLARDREERYLVAHRIYRGSEEEREYLNDAELDAIRAQATADVEEWCN
jgi:hypothetical protein